MTDRAFTPALGHSAGTRYYDYAIALLTREKRWRSEVLHRLCPQADDVIVDVGCGTGTLAILLKRASKGAQIVGVDPDHEVLAIAKSKARDAGIDIDWRAAMGDGLVETVGELSASKVTSSLVLHQCPMPMKRSILAGMFAILRPGGRLVIADYGLQRSALMRLCFRLVQMVDGKADTQPNADGILPSLISQAGFADVREAAVIPTPTGSISIYTARRV